jgi:hypothetical protein
MKKPHALLRLAGALAFGAVALAGTGRVGAEEPPPPHHPHRPPEVAFAACKDLKEGDSCTAKMHDHEVNGTCTLGHETELWCRPQHHEPPPPPPAQ